MATLAPPRSNPHSLNEPRRRLGFAAGSAATLQSSNIRRGSTMIILQRWVITAATIVLIAYGAGIGEPTSAEAYWVMLLVDLFSSTGLVAVTAPGGVPAGVVDRWSILVALRLAGGAAFILAWWISLVTNSRPQQAGDWTHGFVAGLTSGAGLICAGWVGLGPWLCLAGAILGRWTRAESQRAAIWLFMCVAAAFLPAVEPSGYELLGSARWLCLVAFAGTCWPIVAFSTGATMGLDRASAPGVAAAVLLTLLRPDLWPTASCLAALQWSGGIAKSNAIGPPYSVNVSVCLLFAFVGMIRIGLVYNFMELVQGTVIAFFVAAAWTLRVARSTEWSTRWLPILVTAATVKFALIWVYVPERDVWHSPRPQARALAAKIDGRSVATALSLGPAVRFYLPPIPPVDPASKPELIIAGPDPVPMRWYGAKAQVQFVLRMPDGQLVRLLKIKDELPTITQTLP